MSIKLKNIPNNDISKEISSLYEDDIENENDDDDDEKEDKEESQNKDDKDNYDFIRQMSMIYDQNKKK